MPFVNFTMLLGLVMAIICGGYYLVEYATGRVKMSTKWNELTSFQLDCAVLSIIGLSMFLGALVGGAILRSTT